MCIGGKNVCNLSEARESREAHESFVGVTFHIGCDVGKGSYLFLMCLQHGEVIKSLREQSSAHYLDNIEDCDVSNRDLSTDEPFVIT
jgi:hypothetical protein